MQNEFLTTLDAARESGDSRSTWWRVCQKHQGFAYRAGGIWRIPRKNFERVMAGERPADIAAEIRAHARRCEA